jgi:YD repeat-containing protein
VRFNVRFTRMRWFGMALLAVVSQQPQAQTAITSYQYDAMGNVTQITDPLGRVTTHTYDLLNRRTSTTDANNGTTQYAYDGLNQLLRVIDPRNLITTYQPDSRGNPAERQSDDLALGSCRCVRCGAGERESGGVGNIYLQSAVSGDGV